MHSSINAGRTPALWGRWAKAMVLGLSSALGCATPVEAFHDSGIACAEFSHVSIATSLYTRHFSPDPAHHNDQRLIDITAHASDGWMLGASRFRNSFDQASFYLYGGKTFGVWAPTEQLNAHINLTAGLLHGYRGEYRDKIPFNRYEIAPAILPSVGLSWGPFDTDLVIFGAAGVMLKAGLRF